MKALYGKLDEKDKRNELDEIRELLKSNLDKVVQHGKRADSIVKNMLQHSRQGSGEQRSIEINTIVDRAKPSLPWRACGEAGLQHHTGARFRSGSWRGRRVTTAADHTRALTA